MLFFWGYLCLCAPVQTGLDGDPHQASESKCSICVCVSACLHIRTTQGFAWLERNFLLHCIYCWRESFAFLSWSLSLSLRHLFPGTIRQGRRNVWHRSAPWRDADCLSIKCASGTYAESKQWRDSRNRGSLGKATVDSNLTTWQGRDQVPGPEPRGGCCSSILVTLTIFQTWPDRPVSCCHWHTWICESLRHEPVGFQMEKK